MKDKETNKFIIDILITRSEIKRQNTGNNMPKYLFLKWITEKSAKAVMGVKFGGCGISLDEIAIIIIATTKWIFFSFKFQYSYKVLFL